MTRLSFSQLLAAALALAWMVPASSRSASIGNTQIEIAVLRGVAHAPLRVPVSLEDGFSLASLRVTSDSGWAQPSVDAPAGEIVLTLPTKELVNPSYTATFLATDGSKSSTFSVKATVSTGNIKKLFDDPLRSITYGLQQNDGSRPGAVVVYDPLANQNLATITVGRRPVDCAESADGSELLVLNQADASISVIDLVHLRVKEVLPLPFSPVDPESAPADIDVGPGGVIYYTDASWAPVLRVMDRRTRQVIQQVDIEGRAVSGLTNYNGSYGFGSFRLTRSGKFLFAVAQYGWSAGWVGSFISKFSVGTDGRLTFVAKTDSNYPTVLSRDPLDTPVLIPWNDRAIFAKQLVVDPATITTTIASLPTPVYSISPGGEAAATATAIYQLSTGLKLRDLPVAAPVQAFTSDYARFVYFDATAKALKSVDLSSLSEALQQTLSPRDGAIVLSPASLSWSPVPGVDVYDVYLGTSPEDVASAQIGSSLYLGTVNGSTLPLTQSFTPGTTYYWRVDPVTTAGASKGAVRSFTVSTLGADLNAIETATVRGDESSVVNVSLTGASGQAWSAAANVNWVTFEKNSGTVPATLRVKFNAANLAAGMHSAVISISSGETPAFQLPVTLRIEPLALTILKSDRDSARIYGISENTADVTARAYLLEIDAHAEKILRVAPVGSGVTDLAIHHGDNAIYVPNWRTGSLLAIDLATFLPRRAYGFKPAGPTGYGEGDVYRVSAGAPGRLVVEEEDQWIDVSIFDTVNGQKLGTTFEREGGGAFDPTGRYYYHGDNNSSGAEVHKFDVSGDTFAELAHVRVESASYYGSRTIVVSDDGSRVFWNGSVFDADLRELWRVGVEIYSASADGRYALSEQKVYDTSLKKQILSLPLATRVSAVNSASGKILVQKNDRLNFTSIPGALPAPVLGGFSLGPTSVMLTWTDVSLETGFTIQYRTLGNEAWIDAAFPAANAVSAVIPGLENETTYVFRIKADGVTSSSSWSNELSLTTDESPGPLTAPILSSPNISQGVVNLAWSGVPTATSYSVERRISQTYRWETIATLPASETTYADESTLPAETYVYRIAAHRMEETVYSEPADIIIPIATPQNFAGTSKPNSITLTWEDGRGETGYRLERLAPGGSWAWFATLPAGTTKFVDTNVSAGRTYQYRLTAIGSFGDSDPAVVEVPIDLVPVKPTPTPRPRPDREAPVLNPFGASIRLVRSPIVKIMGTASDNRNLKRVEYRLDGERSYRPAKGGKTWLASVRVPVGITPVFLRAEDESGNRSKLSRILIIREP